TRFSRDWSSDVCSSDLTTTAYFVDAAQRARFTTTAVLGTVELRVGAEAIESPRTTVEAPVLHAVLALARERGAGAATVEASSHEIGRASGRERAETTVG